MAHHNVNEELPPSYDEVIMGSSAAQSLPPGHVTEPKREVQPSAPPPPQPAQIADTLLQTAHLFQDRLLYPGPESLTEVVNILCTMPYGHRLDLVNIFYKNFGNALPERVNILFNSQNDLNLYQLVKGLVLPYPEYIAYMIYTSSDYRWFFGLSFTFSNDYIKLVNYHFIKSYNQDISSYLSRQGMDPSRLKPILRMIEARRPSTDEIDDKIMQKDIQDVSAKTSMFSGKPEKREALEDIFYNRSFNHIRTLFISLRERSPSIDMQPIIENICGNADCEAYMNILQYASNSDVYFADLLHRNLMRQDKLNYVTLTNVLLSRSITGDIQAIRYTFFQRHKQLLESNIVQRTTGIYKLALQFLIGSMAV